jgi:hypothetical protein
MMKRSIAQLLCLLSFFALAIPSFAQTFRGGINGTVTDSTGAVVSNAAITATDNATNSVYHAASSSAGEFTLSNLPAGTYVVTIVSPGFSTARYDTIHIEAGSPYTLTAQLAVSSTGTTVEVSAGALAVDTTTDLQATTLPEVIVQNLPNSGRDFTQMLAQTPGFAGLSTGGGAGLSSVDGTRSNSINWQIEGTDNNDLWWNIPAVNQGGVGSIAGVILPIDAIENFSFVTSGATSLGRNPGGTANVIIKSGSNHLHGTAFYFNHNEFFEHSNPFVTGRKAESRLQDYGFSVGGPILKDKYFFFIAGEHQGFLLGGETAATEPTLAYQADAKAVLAAYGVPINPVASNLLNGTGSYAGLWPTSALNCPVGGTASSGVACDSPENYQATGNTTGHSFNGIIKLSANLTPRDTLSVVWFVGQGTQQAPTSSSLTPYYEDAPIHVENYSIVYNRILSSSLSNQLSAGVSYFNQAFSDADTSFNLAGLGLNTGVTNAALAGAPHIIIGPGGASAGLTGSNTGFDPTGVTAPSGRNDITGHIDEDLAWTKGKHQMRFGGEYRNARVDDFYQTGQRGTLYFDSTQGPWYPGNFGSGPAPVAQTPCAALATQNLGNASSAPANVLFLADFLAGCDDPTSSSIVLGDPKRMVFVNTWAVYAQDAFQLSKSFTLDYDLRYDYSGPVHSNQDDLSIFDPTQPSGLAVAGQQVASIYPKYYGAVSPRVGFAWQVDHTGKTVLRGGYGYYYDSVYMKSILQNNGAQNISVFGPGLNPAGTNEVVNAQGLNQVIQKGVDIYPTFAQAAGVGATPGSVSISTFDPHFHPGNTQEWDLNLQRSLTNSVIWQLGYVGTKGTHLMGLFDINPESLGAAYLPCPAADVTASGCSINPAQLTRPYNAAFPNFGVIDEARSNLGSIYHSLQSTLKVQSWHGLTSQLAYTWSHALDYESGLLPYLPQDPTNERAEYGNSDYDVRNTLTGYIDYKIPSFKGPKHLTQGWEVNSGFSFHGGTPYTVDASSNVSGNGENADRALQVLSNPNNVDHSIQSGAVQWFNPNAFVDPTPGTYSPTRRGQNSNPGYNSVDISAMKSTPIAEGVSLLFRANIYNAFDRTNLAPVGFPGTGEAGVIGSTIGVYLGNQTIGPGEPLNTEFSLKVLF